MTTLIKGRIVKVLGDNIDTDVIIPGRYLTSMDPEELGKHALEPIVPEFHKLVTEDKNILVAGENFGCGSSREHAVIALKGAGVKAVIAESFARIFFRNAINSGLWVIECPGIKEAAKEGELVEVNPEEGIVKLESGKTLRVKPMDKQVMEILLAGGLIEYLKRKVA